MLTPPAGADTLFSTEDGAGVLYLDRVSTGGTILATTLDPLRHTGETASPAPTRFLELFLPWVVNSLLNVPCPEPRSLKGHGEPGGDGR